MDPVSEDKRSTPKKCDEISIDRKSQEVLLLTAP